MTRKRVNIVLDEDVHKESVKFAVKAGWDFSEFVNLMLETFLYSEDMEVRKALIKGMFEMEGRKRGFIVTKDTLKLKGEQWHHEKAKKRNK
jgi:hypothetical protein